MMKSGKASGKKKKAKKSNFFGTVSIKETYRKILKRYDRLSANAERLAVPSIRRLLRESIDNEIILVKFVFTKPEPELNNELQMSIIPFVDTLRFERYIHVRLIYVWSIPLLHEDLASLALLLEKRIYLLKHIELIDCLLESYSVQRLCMAINCCSTMTTLVLDYNEFGDEGCHSVCAGLRGNRMLLSLSLCFCDLGTISGEYLSILIGTTAVRELYLDGNNLYCEGVVQLLRFCVERALLEAHEREMDIQRQLEEEEQILSQLELDKKQRFELAAEPKFTVGVEKPEEDSKPEEKKKKKRKRRKKEKVKPPPPPVGPWIYKLHLADNGLDNMSRPAKSSLFACLESIAKLIKFSSCLQEVDINDNCIGELGGEYIAEAIQFRKQVALPAMKLRTTHRIGAEALATITKLGGGLQKKKKPVTKKKKK